MNCGRLRSLALPALSYKLQDIAKAKRPMQFSAFGDESSHTHAGEHIRAILSRLTST